MIDKPVNENLSTAAQAFPLGDFLGAEPWGNGHINDSYRVQYAADGGVVYALLQRINHHLFTHPQALMQNLQRVTDHIAAKCEGHTLVLQRTVEGSTVNVDPEGYHWRCFNFIPDAVSFEKVTLPSQAYQVGLAFGEFQRDVANLPAPRLNETIPNFHHGPTRFTALEKAIALDVKGRVASARAEIDFALERKALTEVLLNANLPERITHNDCKLNNVLLHQDSGEAVCVVDLDTVMPGLLAYDFGDMVRTATCAAAEDETDLSLIHMEMDIFSGLAHGYLEATDGFITREETELLVTGGMFITFLIGVRFLTDYLQGDTYFKIDRPQHNLDRCRTQFKLVESIEAQRAEMEALIASLCRQ